MKTKLTLFFILILALFLRIYQLGQIPMSLNWDETSLGFNAYSISQTLHDEHGEFLPISRFIAFGDYKPPGYIYAAAAFIKLLDLNEFATRLPSALAGVLLTLVAFLIAKELFNKKVGLIAAFVVAISPWSLQFSRGAFEANLATTLTAFGVYFYLRIINQRSKTVLNLLLSACFFAFSIYTFNSHRVFNPLIIGVLILIHRVS